MTAELSVLIVNYNTWRECADAIASLRRNGPTRPDGSPMPFECIVVDNASPQRDPAAVDAVRAQLARLGEEQRDPHAGRLVLHGENGGYSKGMNLGLQHARGRWLLLANPDLVFTEGLIPALQRHLENDPRAGCVVPKGFWDADFLGRLPPNTLPTLRDVAWTTLGAYSRWLGALHSRRLIRTWLRVWTAEAPIALPMMSGCLLLIERTFFESIGRMDERYPLYYEDADLSRTIRRAGRTVVQVPSARLVHLVNRSGNTAPETMLSRHDVSRKLYFRKWYGPLGTWALALERWLVTTPLLRWLRAPIPRDPFTDLGASAQKPTIVLPRRCERFLMLMSIDNRFYLSGGLFGEGDRWTPSDTMFRNFSHGTYWYQAFDLAGGGLEPLGCWRFQCLSHLGAPMPGAAGTENGNGAAARAGARPAPAGAGGAP